MKHRSILAIVLFVAKSTNAFQACPLPLSQIDGFSAHRHNKESNNLVKLQVRAAPDDISAKDALERTASHLEKLKRQGRSHGDGDRDRDGDAHSVERDLLYQSHILRSANSLKVELKELGLPRNGRKPDLAARLTDFQMKQKYGTVEEVEESLKEEHVEEAWKQNDAIQNQPVKSFASLQLSPAAAKALGSADFGSPSPIQEAAIPRLARGESCVLHAETGSGKTLAYLLPITEQLWREVDEDDLGYGVILLPTRELAAQVAGIAQVLAPPGTVRLVFRPTNLMENSLKERGEMEYGGLLDKSPTRASPRLFVGSAKAIMTSLYGDNKMPASPTPKPQAKHFLKNTRWVILDEVDRLLHVKKSRVEERYKTHEKPAAVVTAAVTRMTLGRAQVIAASATVGRPLRRELSRVLGLATQDCPEVVRGKSASSFDGDMDDDDNDDDDEGKEKPRHVGRAVSIPNLVEHYVTEVDGDSTGLIMTAAFRAIMKVHKDKPRKTLLVLTRGCGMSTKNAIGALLHFRCRPEPVSLLDALEADGSDRMIEIHREVSGATGIGETGYFSQPKESDKGGEYLLVTGEDTVRGLHLDGLDFVIVVGKPHGPDEYTHIAGRTGRAGKGGKVISVLSSDGAKHLKSWERMLDVEFHRLEIDKLEGL